MTSDDKAKVLTVIPDRNPTSATDLINIAVRGSGEVMLRMCSSLPDNTLIENHRTLINAEVAKSLIDLLCSSVDYYPTKSKKQKK